MRHVIPLWVALFIIAPLTAQAQTLPDPALQAAIAATREAIPTLPDPLRWEFEILLPTADSALSCPLVPGVQLPEQRTPYVVELFMPGDESYIVHVAQDGSRAQRCDPKFPDMGMATASILPGDTASDACTVTPSGPFANVRAAPDVDAPQTATQEGPRPALGRDADWTWYLIAEGWVAGTVITPAGNCLSNDLSIRSADIALTLAPTDPNAPPPTPPPSLSDTTCPTDFAGYLPPRIQAGAVTAQVEQGGLPNSIRANPTTDAERIGAIQPGRRIDIVHNGPRCSGGFVWWEVEVDDVRGWTAESSATDQAYFLAPTPGNALDTAPTDDSAVLASTSISAITVANVARLSEIGALPATAPDSIPAMTPIQADGSLAYISGSQLFYVDAPLTAPATAPINQLTGATTYRSLRFIPGTDQLLVGKSDGTLDHDSNTADAQLSRTIAAHNAPINALAFLPSDNRLVTGSGDTVTAAPSDWKLRVWDQALLLTTTNPDEALVRDVRFPYPVMQVVFSADGDYMAVVAMDREQATAAGLWVYAGRGLGDNILTLALPDPVNSFVTSVPADVPGDFVYAKNNVLYSLTASTGEERRLLTRPDTVTLTDAAFNPTEPTTLAVAGTDGIGLYDYTALVETPLDNASVLFGGAVQQAAFAEDGTILTTRNPEAGLVFYAIRP